MSDLAIDATILGAAAILANLFVILYLITAPFYRSDAGRASWMMTLSVALLLDVSLVSYWFDWTVPEWLARTIYVLILCACALKFWALVHEQFRARRDR